MPAAGASSASTTARRRHRCVRADGRPGCAIAGFACGEGSPAHAAFAPASPNLVSSPARIMARLYRSPVYRQSVYRLPLQMACLRDVLPHARPPTDGARPRVCGAGMVALVSVGTGPGVITPDGCAVDLYAILPPGPDPDIIHGAIPAGAPILELGSGAGRVTRSLLALGHPVVAVDESPEMLAHVRGAETVC